MSAATRRLGPFLLCLVLLGSCAERQKLHSKGEGCSSNNDCASAICIAGICQAPKPAPLIDLSLKAVVLPPQKYAVTGQIVQLFGGWSSVLASVDITYAWSLETPEGSQATLSDPNSSDPTFVADLPGTYRAALVVTSASGASTPSEMVIHVSEVGQNDMVLFAKLYPAYQTGDLVISQTVNKFERLEFGDPVTIGAFTGLEMVPATDKFAGSPEYTDPQRVVVGNIPSFGLATMRALVKDQGQESLYEPPFLVAPWSLKLDTPVTSYSRIKVTMNRQEIYWQIRGEITYLGTEPCEAAGVSYPTCHKVERRTKIEIPLSSGTSSHLMEYVVEGLGVVKTIELEHTADGTVERFSSALVYLKNGELEHGVRPAMTVRVPQPVSPPSLTDGSRDDWAEIKPAFVDLVGDVAPESALNALDFRTLSLALSADDVFLLFTFTPPANESDDIALLLYLMPAGAGDPSSPSLSNRRLFVQRVSGSWSGKLETGVDACPMSTGCDNLPTEEPVEVQGPDFVEVRVPRTLFLADDLGKGLEFQLEVGHPSFVFWDDMFAHIQLLFGAP